MPLDVGQRGNGNLISSFFKITCGVLSDIPRGRIVCADEDRYNSECTYKCNSGFSIYGSTTRRCLETGKWSGSVPECHRVSCPALLPPDHGSMKCNQESHHNSTCSITCDTCFTLVGSTARRCRADGLWSGEEPLCQRYFESTSHILTFKISMHAFVEPIEWKEALFDGR